MVKITLETQSGWDPRETRLKLQQQLNSVIKATTNKSAGYCCLMHDLNTLEGFQGYLQCPQVINYQLESSAR